MSWQWLYIMLLCPAYQKHYVSLSVIFADYYHYFTNNCNHLYCNVPPHV